MFALALPPPLFCLIGVLPDFRLRCLLLLAIGLAGLGPLALGVRRLRQTTLLAPCCWAIFSWVTLVAVDIALNAAQLGGPCIARFIAGSTTFLPGVALLGAKRPQDRAWQAVVVSLGVVLALPALRSWLFSPGEALTLHPLFSWLLMILILINAVNSLPTRQAASGIFLAAGQCELLQAWLPLPLTTSSDPLWGCGFITTAAVLAWVVGSRPRGVNVSSLDRLWLDFRDAYGVVWALRVAERVNATAKANHWPQLLTWQGFRDFTPKSTLHEPAIMIADLQQNFLSLLRRFVSPAWVAACLGDLNPLV